MNMHIYISRAPEGTRTREREREREREIEREREREVISLCIITIAS